MMIEDLVVGGPAFNCQQLARGDEVLMVDDEPVNADNCFDRLIGSDVPGSLVKICFRSASSKKIEHVILTRISATEMLNNVRVFEIFTSLKDHAYAQRDRFAIEHIDQGIDLWMFMLRQESRQQHCLSRVQTRCREMLSSFQEKVRAHKGPGEARKGFENNAVSSPVPRSNTLGSVASQLEEAAVAPTQSSNVTMASSNQEPGGARESSREYGAGGTGATRGTGSRRDVQLAHRKAKDALPSRIALKNLLQRMEDEVKQKA
jgi:hypothetical protein